MKTVKLFYIQKVEISNEEQKLSDESFGMTPGDWIGENINLHLQSFDVNGNNIVEIREKACAFEVKSKLANPFFRWAPELKEQLKTLRSFNEKK